MALVIPKLRNRVVRLDHSPKPFSVACQLPWDANPDAPIMFVCDPPIYEEGKPVPTKPMATKSLLALAPFMQAVGLSSKDICIVAASAPMTKKAYDSDKQLGEAIKADHEKFQQAVRLLKPKMIIASGKAAARQVYNRSVKITKIRGVSEYSDDHNCVVLPILGIGHIQRVPEHSETMTADLATAARIKENGYSLKIENKKLETTYKWITDLKFLINLKPKMIGLDTESSCFGAADFPHWYLPQSKIMTVQISHKPGHAYVIPIDYPGYPISKEVRTKLIHQLKTLLEDPRVKKVGQNLKHDYLQLKAKLGIVLDGYEDDTLLLVHMINENMQNKSLDEICRIHLPKYAGYKDAFRRKYEKKVKTTRDEDDEEPVEGSIARMDLVIPSDILAYSAADADCVLQLREILTNILKKDPKAYNCYQKVMMPAMRAFCEIEQQGFNINRTALRTLRVKVAEKQKSEYARLIKFIPKEIQDKFRDTGVGLKLTRSALLIDFLYEHPKGLKIKPASFTKTGLPSVSSKTALPYYIDKHPFIADLIKYIKNQKMLDTYIGEATNEHGEPTGFWKYIYNNAIRPSYVLHGPVTGRSACVRADTMIPCVGGAKRIDQIFVGNMVYTHGGKYQRVIRTYLKPVQEMYAVHFTNGEILRCTEDHRLLTDSGKWVTLRNVIIQERLSQSVFAACSNSPISRVLAYHDAACEAAQYNSRHNGRVASPRDTSGRIEEVESVEILGVEARRVKSNEGQASGELSGGMPRWARVLNGSGEWKTLFRASDRRSRDARHTSRVVAESDRGSSYKRRPVEQRTGQSCDSNQKRSFGNTPEVCQKPGTLGITRVEPCGSYPVYDIEVANDHSYEAAGCFSHNSRDPNGQNFPKRGEFAKEFRAIFEAPEGWVLVEADYSQLELRIAGTFAKEPTFIKIYKSGGDIHCATAAIVMGITLEEFMRLKTADPEQFSLMRYRAKAVNFGFIYGMGWRKFLVYAKTEYDITYTEQEAKNIRAAYFSKYRFARWHEEVKSFANQYGYVRAPSGRARHLPAVKSDDDAISSSAERQAVNSPVQGFGSDMGLIALARINAEIDKSWLRVIGFVHDAIICIAKKGREIEAARVLKRYMETNPLKEWFGFTFPIPIVADVSIGMNLAKTIELKSEWLNDNRFQTFEQIKAHEDADKAEYAARKDASLQVHASEARRKAVQSLRPKLRIPILKKAA